MNRSLKAYFTNKGGGIMALEITLGTEPEFMSRARSYFSEEKNPIREVASDDRFGVDIQSLFSSLRPDPNKDQSRSMILVDSSTGATCLSSVSGRIIRISQVNPFNQQEVVELLKPTHGFMEGESFFASDKTHSIGFFFSTHSINDNADGVVTCAIYVTKHQGGMWSACVLLLDLGWLDCKRWFIDLENTIRAWHEGISFDNSVGLCSVCKQDLPLELHNHWTFVCEECTSREKEEKTRKETDRKERKKQNSSPRKPNPLRPDQTLLPDQQVRRALYTVYEGKCQYCQIPEKLPMESMCIEHIISRSSPIESISLAFRNEGVSEEAIERFRTEFLPPQHNCALNFTIACLRHNSIKNDQIMSLAGLEFILSRAKKKAMDMLRIHSELQVRKR